MDRRSQMCTIGWLFVCVTLIIPAVNNSLIGRGFRLFRAIERLCIGHRKYEALAPFPAARKSSRRLNLTWKLLLCKGETVELLGQFVTVNFNVQSCWGKIYPLLLQVDKKDSYTCRIPWSKNINDNTSARFLYLVGNDEHIQWKHDEPYGHAPDSESPSAAQLWHTTGGLEGERSGPDWGQRGFCCAGISR